MTKGRPLSHMELLPEDPPLFVRLLRHRGAGQRINKAGWPSLGRGRGSWRAVQVFHHDCQRTMGCLSRARADEWAATLSDMLTCQNRVCIPHGYYSIIIEGQSRQVVDTQNKMMSSCVGPCASNRLPAATLQFGVIGPASVMPWHCTVPSQVFRSYARLAKKLSQRVLNAGTLRRDSGRH